MKNIHLIPTDKPSRLGRFIDTNNLFLRVSNDIPRGENVNIYITNDENPKSGDWGMSLCDDESYGEIYQCKDVELVDKSDRKIILTDNEDLIKDGVQAIDNEFLEWFVKNPSCEEVEVQKFYGFAEDYLIIIPKEESNFYEKLVEYFKNTPREKVLEDWNKSVELDNVGPTIEEFLNNTKK